MFTRDNLRALGTALVQAAVAIVAAAAAVIIALLGGIAAARGLSPR